MRPCAAPPTRSACAPLPSLVLATPSSILLRAALEPLALSLEPRASLADDVPCVMGLAGSDDAFEDGPDVVDGLPVWPFVWSGFQGGEEGGAKVRASMISPPLQAELSFLHPSFSGRCQSGQAIDRRLQRAGGRLAWGRDAQGAGTQPTTGLRRGAT
jgi:hypothetical protein